MRNDFEGGKVAMLQSGLVDFLDQNLTVPWLFPSTLNRLFPLVFKQLLIIFNGLRVTGAQAVLR